MIGHHKGHHRESMSVSLLSTYIPFCFHENGCLPQKELAESLEVTEATISKRLKTFEDIQKDIACHMN